MCKHNNISIIEFGTATISHDRELDGHWSHVSDTGRLTGIIEVTCYQCGFSKTYGRKRPKWVLKYMEEFYING